MLIVISPRKLSSVSILFQDLCIKLGMAFSGIRQGGYFHGHLTLVDLDAISSALFPF